MSAKSEILARKNPRKCSDVILIASRCEISPDKIIEINSRFDPETSLIVYFNNRSKDSEKLFNNRYDLRIIRTQTAGIHYSGLIKDSIDFSAVHLFNFVSVDKIIKNSGITGGVFTFKESDFSVQYPEVCKQLNILFNKVDSTKQTTVGFASIAYLRKLYPDSKFNLIGFTFEVGPNHYGDIEKKICTEFDWIEIINTK